MRRRGPIWGWLSRAGLFLAVLAAPAAAVAAAPDAGRLALVVGVADYGSVAGLKSPVEDAQQVGIALRDLGFDADVLPDPDLARFWERVHALAARATTLRAQGIDVTLVVYFSGHAVDADDGEYLIPRGFRGLATSNLQASAIPAQALLHELSATRAQRILFVLDSCRDNPWAPGKAGTRTVTTPPLPSGESQDVYIWFSAQAGHPAQDSPRFATAFAREVSNPAHLSLADAFAAIQKFVWKESGNTQRPAAIGSMDYSLALSDEERRRLASSISPLLSRIIDPATGGAGARRAASGVAQREPRDLPAGLLPALVTVAPYRGEPCPEPGTEGDGIAVLARYIALHGIGALESGAAAGRVCEEWLLGVWHLTSQHPDREKAVSWLLRAEHDGSLRAINSLIYAYQTPELGPVDEERALFWMKQGVARGAPLAIFKLATRYERGLAGTPKNVPVAILYYEQALRLGYSDAATALGYVYRIGGAGQIELSPKLAIHYYEAAIKMGNWQAAASLAFMYAYGVGVERNDALANDYYRSAAKLGDRDSFVSLAERADRGQGFASPDPTAATEFYRQAAMAGAADAMVTLGDRYLKGVGAPIDPALGRGWYDKAWQKGNPDGALRLSREYFRSHDLARAESYARNVLSSATPANAATWPITFVEAGQLLQEIAAPGGKPLPADELALLQGQYGRPGNMKRFSVPVTCGEAGPIKVDVYVFDWGRSYSPAKAQFDWLERQRGCTVPADASSAFEKLYAIARDNRVSFVDLAVYALDSAKAKSATPPTQ